MSNRQEELQFVSAEVTRLTKVGVLGFYTHFEVTEVIAFRESSASPINVFSIIVAEDRAAPPKRDTEFLGSRITLKSMKGWTFGICRYVRTVPEILDALTTFQSTAEWRPSGKMLDVGDVVAVPTQFVAADTTVVVPWNNVLKNNFWNGSYVVELVSPEKTALKPFFDDPPALQELSEHIQKVAPIRLASLSDRLGNIAFQIPVTVLVSTFANQRLSGDTVVSLGWHPKASPRTLRATCDMQHDDILTGYASALVSSSPVTIPTSSGQGMQRAALWDDQNHVLLAATGSTAFIKTIVTNMHIGDPEPRVFSVPDKGGGLRPVRIGLSQSQKMVVNAPGGDRGEAWTRGRIYRDEAARLSRERRFVQYRPSGSRTVAHDAALMDLHFLLNRYGEDAAWLWDPYLTATDILETLFYCPHSGADLRALTAATEIPGEKSESQDGQTRHEAFADSQRTILENARSNWRGLRLEYRMRSGTAGWSFHDRFLIFPMKDGGAHAWSLGTSVNSFGTAHHILQKVDDGRMVMDAFVELWDQLAQPQHLILKKP